MINRIKNWIVTIIVWVPLIVVPSFSQAMWFWDMFGVSWVGVPWTNAAQEDSLIHTIQTAINWVLGMLSFVALVLCLYAGFQMLISWWDSKKYDAWFTILKNAAIWLAIIAVSWLIVSLIFWIINGSINPNISEEASNNDLYPTNQAPNWWVNDIDQF